MESQETEFAKFPKNLSDLLKQTIIKRPEDAFAVKVYSLKVHFHCSLAEFLTRRTSDSNS